MAIVTIQRLHSVCQVQEGNIGKWSLSCFTAQTGSTLPGLQYLLINMITQVKLTICKGNYQKRVFPCRTEFRDHDHHEFPGMLLPQQSFSDASGRLSLHFRWSLRHNMTESVLKCYSNFLFTWSSRSNYLQGNRN